MGVALGKKGAKATNEKLTDSEKKERARKGGLKRQANWRLRYGDKSVSNSKGRSII